MNLRASLAAILSVVAVSSIGCASSADDAGSAESNETTSNWSMRQIGYAPGHDVTDNEQVGLAIDASGHRHAIYLSRADNKTHYVDLTTNQDVAIEANQTSHAHLALDPQGQPHVTFSSDKGVAHASKKNGQWVVDATGVNGTANAIAVDNAGTVHIASSGYDTAGVSTATVSSLKAGATAFENAKIPGKVEGEIGFDVNALAVDASGGEYLMLSSIMFVDDSPTSSHSTDEHAYFVRRPAGGQFSVEMMDKSLQNSAASIAIDGSGNIHAVVAGPANAPDVTTAPYYIHRGPNDSSWSAAEKIHWDGYWTSLEVDASGNVHVAITGDRSQYAKYAKRTAAGWTVELVSTGDAHVPTIALDPSGKPIMAMRIGNGAYYIAERTSP